LTGFFFVEIYLPVRNFILLTLYPNKYITEIYTASSPFLANGSGGSSPDPGADR